MMDTAVLAALNSSAALLDSRPDAIQVLLDLVKKLNVGNMGDDPTNAKFIRSLPDANLVFMSQMASDGCLVHLERLFAKKRMELGVAQWRGI